MANYGQPDFHISIGTASGVALSALKDISQYVLTINGFDIEAMTQQSDAFGDSWVERLYTGIKQVGDIQIGGFYDDVAASGPHAIMGQTSDLGADRPFELNFGASDVANGRYVLAKYVRLPKRGALTEYQATLRVTGAVATAT